MGYNKKLIIAGLAASVSVYMLYKASKERKEHKAQKLAAAQSSSSSNNATTTHTPADYKKWQAAAPFLAAGALGAGGAAAYASSHHSSGFGGLFSSSSISSSSSQPSGPPPAYTPGDLPWSALTDEKYLTSILAACVMDQNLHAFYDIHALRTIAQRIAQQGALAQAAESWQLPPALAVDLCKLALFDVCFLLDDSASMNSEDGRIRKEQLRTILRLAADAAGRFDPDGMEVRWMNDERAQATIHNAAEAERFASASNYAGRATPLAHALRTKILEPLVLRKVQQGGLAKPVLVIVITDGRPTGPTEGTYAFKRTLTQTRAELDALFQRGARCDPDSISYMLAAVGNDREAQEFLDQIDADDEVGQYVDVCSDIRAEAQQVRRATGIELTQELHALKILCGGIDSSFDESDEASGARLSSRKLRKRQENKQKALAKYPRQREALRAAVQQLLSEQPAIAQAGQQRAGAIGVHDAAAAAASAQPQVPPQGQAAVGGGAQPPPPGYNPYAPPGSTGAAPHYDVGMAAKDGQWPPPQQQQQQQQQPNYGYPSSSGGYPPQDAGYPPQQPGSGYPPQNSGYPPAHQQQPDYSGYPPQNYNHNNSSSPAPYPPATYPSHGAPPAGYPPAPDAGGGYPPAPGYGMPPGPGQAQGQYPDPNQQQQPPGFGGGFVMPSARPYGS